MKKILLFFISVLCCVSFYAQTFRPDEQDLKNFYCKITDSDKKEVNIASDYTITGHIVIPEKITYKEVIYSVTSVADNGFHKAEMTSLLIPNSIKAIGKSAFHECSSLTEITIPDGIEKIEEQTFRHCTSLTKVVLPNSIRSIERMAFYSCGKLESINLPDSLIYLGDGAFNFCSKLKTISIPLTLTMIPDAAFASCSELESIELHEGIMSIGEIAFSSCRKLENITLGENIISIGSEAFEGCLVLNDLYSKSKIAPELGTDVFDDTPDDLIIHVLYNASGYTVENGWTATISYDLGDYVFQHENLTYTITNYGKKEVSVRANDGLIEDAVVIPQTVVYEEENYTITQVEDKAFMDCNKVTSLTIPASVTMIGDSAFVGCTNLAELHAKRLDAPVLGTDVFDGIEDITTVYVELNATGYTVENGWIVQVIYDEDEQGNSIENIYENVNVYVVNHILFIESEIEEYIHIYSIYGNSYSFKLNIGVNKLSLPQGIYIVKGKKVIV